MALDLSWVLDHPVQRGTKGLPDVPEGFSLRDVAGQGWQLLSGDIPMPVATLRADVVRNNARAMQSYVHEHSAKLAPHGKTTMCPQLFAAQLEAGAWAITVANVAQAQVCHRLGAPRILIANEVIGRAEIALLVGMCVQTPGRDLIVLVDSIDGAHQLQAGFAQAPANLRAQVLIEVGMRGGRCGVRDVESAVGLARELSSMDRIQLCGIEGYEGLIITGDAEQDATDVIKYLSKLVEAVRILADYNLFDQSVPILSAGGSVYYDLVASLNDAAMLDRVDLVVRSGCYLTQDAGFYRRALDHVVKRSPPGRAPRLGEALEIWTRVLSIPEPGRAILSAGKRDLSFDIDLPVPHVHFREGMAEPLPLSGWRVSQLSDQHAFALSDGADASELRVGDIVSLGISHPCTTFDKWPVLLEIDDRHRVTGAVRTYF